jgi:hypothetical protein
MRTLQAWVQRMRVFTLVWLLGLCIGCSEAARTTVFERAISPHGDYTLTTYVVAPWFPHGPHFVTLELLTQNGAAREQLLKTELAYDGVPFTKKNISLRWTGERAAFLCLSATDRQDKGAQITLLQNGAARVVLRKGC